MARITTAGLAALHPGRLFLLGLVLLLAVLSQEAAADCTPLSMRYRPRMGTGYKANLLATGLRSPRGIAMDAAGNLLVVEQQGGSVRRLVLKEDGENVCVDSSTTIVTGGTVSF